MFTRGCCIESISFERWASIFKNKGESPLHHLYVEVIIDISYVIYLLIMTNIAIELEKGNTKGRPIRREARENSQEGAADIVALFARCG